ncbi:MAG: asparaginase [Alphaproteobacteria bacterium]
MTSQSSEEPAPLSVSSGKPSPILVEATRGRMVENCHRGRAAVVDPDGGVLMSWGDVEAPIYARSAIKPLQALPLVESGAADAFGLGEVELALACASHGGEPAHVDAVGRWLDRLGYGVDDLECGAHPPLDRAAARDLVIQGAEPTPLHNNCSGKHAGMVTTAHHLGEPTRGYVDYAHPVQQRILGVLEIMCGCDLGAAPRSIDACSIPAIAIPLGNVALGMARLVEPARLSQARAEAAGRIVEAMTAQPFMVAVSGRFSTRLMTVAGAEAIVKAGAEGVYCAALRRLGLGVALKIDDGSRRAAEVAMAAILRHLGVLDDRHAGELPEVLAVPIESWNGVRVGEARPAPELLRKPA